MPDTKNQQLRQEYLHGLLSHNRLTKSELLMKINELLAEHDIRPIHVKTLNNDLTDLVNQGAEIHRPNRGDNTYYYMEQFFPSGSHFDEEDIAILKQGVVLLRKIAGFKTARDIENLLSKMKYLRFSIINEQNDYIAFEDHTEADGIEWLDKICEAIVLKNVIQVCYKPFNHKEEQFLLHPYFLKEYRNRWFVLGRHHIANDLHILALDRIKSVKAVYDAYLENDLFDSDVYFKDMVGVTRRLGEKPEMIRLKVNAGSASYIESKKIIRNQQTVKRNKDGSIEVELKAVINYELISTILGFGSAVQVIDPEILREKVIHEFTGALKQY